MVKAFSALAPEYSISTSILQASGRHVAHTHSCKQNTHTQIIKKINLKKKPDDET